jgi:hypothetical protein
MDVVGGRVVRILVGKAVPQVGPDELAQAERSADVGLVDLVEVEPGSRTGLWPPARAAASLAVTKPTPG